MKVSLNWLRELVELPARVEELVELLTLAGIEVERVERRGSALADVIVAQIRESTQHPNADRLSVCQVDDGSGKPRQIVCGAKNYKVGDKVLLALPGALLPGDFKIKIGKLRGVESHGMMCSSKELQLGEDSDGLLILPPETAIGTPIAEVFPGDTILDLEITPNRPDLLSVVGIAREVAALSRKPIKLPQLRVTKPVPACDDIEISIPSCWLYSARKIEGVKVGSSPQWLARKLEAIGLHPINNIVDITNYVMVELGQPLHAFDAAKVRGKLRVRSARDGEQLRALDHKTYTLASDDIVVADDEAALAIGGVIGGQDSAVSDTTSAVWLEAADFKPQSIRRTSRRLGLVTDSSYRFERGVDWEAVLYASQRATELIVEIAGGEAAAPLRLGYSPPFSEQGQGPEKLAVFFPGQKESNGDSDPKSRGVIVVPPLGKGQGPIVELSSARVSSLLGRHVSEAEIHDILTRLGLESIEGKWCVPSFRTPDLGREVDLIEEIARVIGMETIPSRSEGYFAPASATDRSYDRSMAIRRACAAQGLHEARSVALVPEKPLGLAYTRTAPESLHRVKNPMIDDQVVLRPNLLHGLLRAVRINAHAGEKSVRLFEVGRVYSAHHAEEFPHLGIVLSGPLHDRSWRGSEKNEADIFTLKGIVSAVLDSNPAFEREENPALPLALRIAVRGQAIGFAGQLAPADGRALDATAPILFAEIDLAALEKIEAGALNRYHDIPRYPAITRDIAVLAPLTLAHARIVGVLEGAREPLLTSVELFDVFNDRRGERLPADKKSLAYSLTYRAPDRTLTADEVNAAHVRLKERLKTELGVVLRE